MGKPINRQDWVDSMYDWAGIEIMKSILVDFPDEKTTILDVGAGWGKYGYLLSAHYHNVDALDIWWVQEGVYRNETIKDAAEYEMPEYDAVVCSDCLEHMTVGQAQRFIKNLNCKKAYIVVPFEMEQEAVDGNPHEEHKQDDLTPMIMKQRYPELTMIKSNETKGLYLWQK